MQSSPENMNYLYNLHHVQYSFNNAQRFVWFSNINLLTYFHLNDFMAELLSIDVINFAKKVYFIRTPTHESFICM